MLLIKQWGEKPARSQGLWALPSSGKERHNKGFCIMY